MTLLSLINKVCGRFGIPQTSTVYGSTDDRILQLMYLLEEEGEDLSSRHNWATLTSEVTHTTIANENQGAIATIAPGYSFIKNNTLWDRTDVLQVLGPLNGQEWQGLKAITNTGPRYQFRLRDSNLYINPVPTAGHTLAFEYQTDYWILDVNGSTKKGAFTADTDTFLLPDRLLLLGLRWRWAAEKGLNYSELYQSYEFQVKDAMGRDGGKPILHADGQNRIATPGIFINPMSWTVP